MILVRLTCLKVFWLSGFGLTNTVIWLFLCKCAPWLSDTNTHKIERCAKTGLLTIFTCRSSRYSRIIYWIVGCNLLGNQGHHCIIRYLKNRHKGTVKSLFRIQLLCFFHFFHLCRSVAQHNMKKIYHCVGVIFYTSHWFWFCVNKQRMCHYLYVLSSAHTYNTYCTYDEWRAV